VTDVRTRLEQHLQVLVEGIGARPPGSPANRHATTYARDVLTAADCTVTEAPFTTRWWEPGPGSLELGGRTLDVDPNPYSRAGEVRGRAVLAGRLEELEALPSVPDDLLVLTDELTTAQVLPAAFPFLDLPDDRRIRAALHRLAPAGVVAVSDHWEPILEDPDLPFPSTTITTELGQDVHPGDELHLVVSGAVHPGAGVNLSTHLGHGDRRLVLCAHLDSKATTPGAFDNAASVAILLTLAELGHLDVGPIELVLFNGEDHYDACGEVAWLAATDLGEIAGVCNLDGVGFGGQRTSLASLACPDPLAAALEGWVARRAGWVAAEPWYESDHAILAMRGIPAVAITTEDVHALLGGLAHTPADTLDVLDLDLLEQVAGDLPDLLALLVTELTR
jgi:aminopeptidase YwaD